uniref:Uncharacterized protein n=1 Tax=Candidatus Kentrum eta TaxID=2126337 RepID=A0A450VAM1_9GAMM|nr:MAG: hypothetical protein BECKH772B_GA0070898_102115 [Candidatus Kentron sp. H]VFK01836.1 MAG: hypothetical protein BECKH772A_GA0070896_102435 [Candidatus Kentron sp. H]VFK05210.1 MAG: hypothetical protein BECKH772C_GA0070978_102475 [Candidatus Kentron sp. H]
MDSIWVGFGIGVLSGLIAGLILHFVLNREHDSRVRVKVFDHSDSYSSNNFYLMRRKAIAKAKGVVVEYGEGFITDPPERFVKAKVHVDGMRAALFQQQKMTWTRIQTKNPFDKKWADLLRNLQKEFPKQFKLFLLDNRPGDHLLSVVLIDPRTRSRRIFLLISKPFHIGGKSKINIAHSGVMIKGSRVLSEAFYDRLNDLCDLAERIEPDTPENVPSHS